MTAPTAITRHEAIAHLDFTPPCDASQCGHPATWTAALTCCGERLLRCGEHRQEILGFITQHRHKWAECLTCGTWGRVLHDLWHWNPL